MKDRTSLVLGVFCSLLGCQSISGPTIIDEYHNKNNEFEVYMEFVVFADQIENHKIVLEKFKEAINYWSSVVPIRVQIFMDDSNNLFSFLYNKPSYNAIEVHIADIQSSDYNCGEYVVGMWQPDKNRLLLDSDSIERLPEQGESIVLHEVGHILGLPHIINQKDTARPGYIILNETLDAEDYVMYPYVLIGKKQSTLSPLEIDLAGQYVKYTMTNPTHFGVSVKCALNLKR